MPTLCCDVFCRFQAQQDDSQKRIAMLTQWPIQSKTIMKFQIISILSTNQSLCKSQKLKFDILKLIISKRFNIFCFNNRWISIKYNEWIGWSYLLFWQAFQHSELLRNSTISCKIWNWEVEKHKINIVVVLFFNLFWSNFEILQECNTKVHQNLYLKSKWLQILLSTI